MTRRERRISRVAAQTSDVSYALSAYDEATYASVVLLNTSRQGKQVVVGACSSTSLLTAALTLGAALAHRRGSGRTQVKTPNHPRETEAKPQRHKSIQVRVQVRDYLPPERGAHAAAQLPSSSTTPSATSPHTQPSPRPQPRITREGHRSLVAESSRFWGH